MFLFFVLYHFNAFWRLLWLGNLARDFNFEWLNFGQRTFFLVLVDALGIFEVLIFTPIRSSLPLEIRSAPRTGIIWMIGVTGVTGMVGITGMTWKSGITGMTRRTEMTGITGVTGITGLTWMIRMT